MTDTYLNTAPTSTQNPFDSFKEATEAEDTASANTALAALYYSKNYGWMVFPADVANKKSYKKADYSNGQRWGKTDDEDEICRDWAKWENAGVGVATGVESGIFVLEVDTLEGHDVDGFASLRTLEERYGPLPRARRAQSPSGSLHFYFKYPWGLEDGSKVKTTAAIVPGVDVRGDGGMVIAPPSVRPGKGMYRWVDEGEVADAPQWLLSLVIEKPYDPQYKTNGKGSGHSTAYACAAMERECEKVAQATKGLRNHALNCAAFALAQLVSGGELDSNEVMSRLFEAASANGLVHDDGATAVKNTIKSGMEAGLKKPRGTPEDVKPECGVSSQDFYAYMPEHKYIFAPSREMWAATSVNSRIPPMPALSADGKPVVDKKGDQVYISATTWLDQNRPVEQMTWAPGFPMIVEDRLISHGGWIERKDVSCFNLYRAPTIMPGSYNEVRPWLDHIYKIYPNDADHIIKWFAWRVQRPDLKINHALVLGSNDQGIGKDTMIEPVKRAVGPWNFEEVSPQMMMGRFNGFLKSVILRVNEAHDLGDFNRYQFYDHMKAYTAAPPDVLRVDEKYLPEHSVLNCVGVVITTNHKTDGIYLPAEDRRHYVAWSQATKGDFTADYWNDLWGWMNNGGDSHVAAYLLALDVSSFDPKAPPPKTAAFWEIVDANRAPEDAELMDVIDHMENPDALTLADIMKASLTGTYNLELCDWLKDRKNRRAIPHRLEKCGYVPVRNDADERDGQWRFNNKRQTIYAKKNLSLRDQLRAVKALMEQNPT